MQDIIYKEVERRLRFVRVSAKNDASGPCPFHKGGTEKNPSFYINLDTGLFYCHACKAKGTFIQFLKRFDAPAAMIDAVMELRGRQEWRKPRQKLGAGIGEHVLNEALLGVFQYCPTDLVEDGFDEKLLQRLEIGFDKNKMRITFPIRDIYGSLVGISGRSVTGEWPRYKVYKSQDLLEYAPDDPQVIARYRTYDIKNHNHLWNFHNVYPSAFFGDLDTVIVAEGYKACTWLIQNGFENAVALQGSSLTWAQEQLLGRLDATIILFLDNDQAGKEGTFNAGWALRRNGHRVLAVSYPDGCDERTQPDDLDKPALLDAIDAAEDWHFWRKKNNAILIKAEELIRAKGPRLCN